VRPLDYRDLVWTIAQGELPGELVLLESADEHGFDPARRGRPTGLAVDLSELLGRGTRGWTRERSNTDAASATGQRLWSALPPEARASVAAGDLLRLKIATDVPAVGDLPWEWLHDGNDFVGLRPSIRLVRSVPVRVPTPPLSVAGPLKVLLVVPNASDERLLDAPTEIEAVMAGLRGAEYDVDIVEYPSEEVLRHSVERDPPNIVHFIGHGGLNHGEGSLILQDPDGRSRWLSATDLASILPASVRLLCLSTPATTENYQILGLSHLARAAGLVALPTTITNQYPVGPEGAERFWTAFYGALVGERGNVNDAVHQARLATFGATGWFADWGSFSLVVRDQTGVSFDLGRTAPETEARRSIELAAQYSSQFANDLAQQVTSLGDDAPAGLLELYEVEHSRAEKFIEDLSE
jgi:hypothetical protein